MQTNDTRLLDVFSANAHIHWLNWDEGGGWEDYVKKGRRKKSGFRLSPLPKRVDNAAAEKVAVGLFSIGVEGGGWRG